MYKCSIGLEWASECVCVCVWFVVCVCACGISNVCGCVYVGVGVDVLYVCEWAREWVGGGYRHVPGQGV